MKLALDLWLAQRSVHAKSATLAQPVERRIRNA